MSLEVTWNTFQLFQKPDGFLVVITMHWSLISQRHYLRTSLKAYEMLILY